MNKILKTLSITLLIMLGLFVWLGLDVVLVHWFGDAGHALWLFGSLGAVIFYMVYEYGT